MEEQESEIVVYRCTECGKLSVSVGWLHAHIEKHQGFGPWNIIPNPLAIANSDRLMERTEVLRVTEFERIGLEEVEDVG